MNRLVVDAFWQQVRRDFRLRPLEPARLRGAIQLVLRSMRNGR